MKTKFLLGIFFAAGLLAATLSHAQTLTTFDFSVSNGANPSGNLTLNGNVFYGATLAGGISNAGTLFAANSTGLTVTNLYIFTNGIDGRAPQGGMVLAGKTLYGTTELGGLTGNGSIFAIATNGTGFTNIYNFSGGGDGQSPMAGLVLGSNVLYGTTFFGGEYGNGAIFSVNTNGSNFATLYSFPGGTGGGNPAAGLILAGTTLFGTTSDGNYNGSGYGTVFKLNTDGTLFTNLYHFTNGTDGSDPESSLILAGSTLFGTAFKGGGTYGLGTLFSVTTNATGFASVPFSYNLGANPQSSLFLSGSTLYGTAGNGGASGFGTVFQVNTNLTGLTNIYSFADSVDGAMPESSLLLIGATLYGSTFGYDASGDYGTLFGLTLSNLAATATLNIATVGKQVVLSWSSSLHLQSASTVNGTYTDISGATSPYTNSASASQQFFRLSSN